MKKNLSLLDLGFFLTETEASPKHVAGFMRFDKPADAGPDFVNELYRAFLEPVDIQPPFDQIIQFSGLRPPHWESATDFALENHIFLHRLPGRGGQKALLKLIGELHGPKMARDNPIWEFHLIDNAGSGQFAIYNKIHHAYADGMTLSRWLNETLSSEPEDQSLHPIWAIAPLQRSRRETEGLTPVKLVRALFSSTRDQLRVMAGLSKLGAQLALEQLHLTSNAVAVPFSARHNTPLTGQVTSGRQVAIASVPMDKVNKLKHLTRSTLNHIALTCIDCALHSYLTEQGVELDEPICIQMPVNLREAGDASGGNKIGIVLVELAGRSCDPYERLREIGFTLRNVRYQVDGVPAGSVALYTIFTALIAQIAESLGLSDRLPPLGNTLVSNVPGPRQALYLKGARLREMYPISALTPANRLNITLYSYDQNLHFGLVATRDLPGLQNLGKHIANAFSDLEKAVRDQ